MYINNDEFEKWMEKLSKKLNEIEQDIKALTDKSDVNILDENGKLLLNHGVRRMLHIFPRTLQYW